MSETHISRRRFLGVSAGSGLAVPAWLRASAAKTEKQAPPESAPPSADAVPGPGLVPSATYPETTARLAVTDPTRFTIMQLTDTHLLQPRDHYLSRDVRSVDEWRKMVDLYRPDVLVVTGDFWHNYDDGRWEEGMQQAVAWVSGLGVPWCFAWGNHDQLHDYPRGHDYLHDAPGSLYRGGPGQGNYIVEVTGPDGKPLWELLCLNTHREGLAGPTLAWLRALVEARGSSTAAAPPAFAFFHIPLPQHLVIRNAPQTAGITYEEPSRRWPKPERVDDTAFRVLKELGTVRACFCGHLHKQDYSGIHEGIELAFGRSSSWTSAGWVEVRKGVKLITVNTETGAYTIETAFPEGLRWRPKPGEKTTHVVDEPWMQDPLQLYQGLPPAASQMAALTPSEADAVEAILLAPSGRATSA